MNRYLINVRITANFLLLIMLTMLRIAFNKYQNLMDNMVQVYELLIHISIIYFNVKIYKHTSADDKKIMLWIILSNICFSLNDVVFYFAIFLKSPLNHLVDNECSCIQLLLNNIPFTAWIVTTTIFLGRLLTKNTLTISKLIKATIILSIVNIIMISYYWMPVNFHNHILSYNHRIFIVLTSIAELLIFELSAMCLIHSKSNKLSLILSGIIIMISGDFLTTYSRMAQVEELFKYGDSVWCFGMLLMLSGFIKIYQHNDFSIDKWLNSSSNIKSKISTWALLTSLLSFIVFFITASYFKILDKHAFVMLPLYVMLYSICVIVLSLKMGSFFENPFNRIKENISNVINDKNLVMNDNFAIDEFIILQNFLVDAIKTKENQNTLKRKFGDIAAEAAHDIVSPINALKVILKKIKSNKFKNEDINIISRAIEQIQNITGHLLTQYRQLDSHTLPHLIISEDDENQPRYFLLNRLIQQIIYDKNTEWNNFSIIDSKIDSYSSSSWLFASPLQISRTISNLLNNAYESLRDDNKKLIIVKLYKENDYFHISIQDFGCGIPTSELNNVLAGKSLKHEGKGIGLSSAKKYIASINGTLDIYSTVGYGTTIKIVLPISSNPVWYSNTIEYTRKSTIIIVDDDLTVLMTWQNLLPTSVSSKFFSTADEFIEWINENKSSEVLLITDYNLNSNHTGLDIIQMFPQVKSFLVTSYAEELWLQEIAMSDKFALIPKSQITSFKFKRS